MAAVTLSSIATLLEANKAGVATESTLTQANVSALAALVTLLANRHGDSVPLMKLLSETNNAQLIPG